MHVEAASAVCADEAKQAMGWLDGLKALANAIDTEYDRRIRTASNVKQYKVGGHGTHGSHGPHGGDGHAADHQNETERLQGEGGAVGALQSTAGPQLDVRGQGTGDRKPDRPSNELDG